MLCSTQAGEEAPRLTLAARKHIGKKDVQTIVHCKAATLVAVLSDGLLTLLDADLLDAHPLPGIKARPLSNDVYHTQGQAL